MKRKYFSALLMGALTIASVSTFTSCKDYDDDISNLQQQIDSNEKQLRPFRI
jgi:peptidoglycan hydrolase CwlO-like protein